MCLILVAWRMNERHPVVLAANRDEFHARPSAPASWWSETSGLLAGRDLSAGGTWLGLTRSGRLAALTNHLSAVRRREDAPSRGGIVTSLLGSRAPLSAELERLERIGSRYNGFNVIFSDGERLGVYETERGVGRELPPGIYGLSNDVLDTPWPKVRHAKSRLEAALEDPEPSRLLALLRDDLQAPDLDLPDTGVGREWERLLSSAFIRSPDYGTRCSTVVRIDETAHACFEEWSWDARGEPAGHVRFDIQLQRPDFESAGDPRA